LSGPYTPNLVEDKFSEIHMALVLCR
jgi:hypothetical protein